MNRYIGWIRAILTTINRDSALNDWLVNLLLFNETYATLLLISHIKKKRQALSHKRLFMKTVKKVHQQLLLANNVPSSAPTNTSSIERTHKSSNPHVQQSV